MNEINTILKVEIGVAKILDLIINCKINLIHRPSGGGILKAMGLAMNKNKLVYVYIGLRDGRDSTASVEVLVTSVVSGKCLGPEERCDISFKDYAAIISILEFKRKALSY